MSLYQYKGSYPITIPFSGQKRTVKPGDILSEDDSILKLGEFEELGKGKRIPHPNNLTLKTNYKINPRLELLDNDTLPKVSICIVTKDNFNIIHKCLDSIHKFVKYPNCEVLLCDTGTTDQKVLDMYAYIQSNSDASKIKVFTGHKYNYSINNNFLASQATGEVLLFLNNDVFFTYDAVSEMVKYIQCSNMGCLGHRLVFAKDPNAIQHDGQKIYDENGGWFNPATHHNLFKNIKSISPKNVIVEGVTAACLMVRKTVFNEVNGFDEDYKDVYQDVDLNLKIATKGYINFCIREKALIHVDHGTRDEKMTPEYYVDSVKFNNTWRVRPFPIKKVKYSVLVCATNKQWMEKLYNSIYTTDPYEFIFLNNKNNIVYSAESLNILTEVSIGKYMFMMHQDTTFTAKEPFKVFEEKLKLINSNFGVIGVAGVTLVRNELRVNGINFMEPIKHDFEFRSTETLDELALILNRENNLHFGEYLDHFHFYGADVCCYAMNQGFTNFVVNLPIMHHSGGADNLTKGDGYQRFMEQGVKFYRNWRNKYPYIATTTTRFIPLSPEKWQIHYFIADAIGLKPRAIEIN